MPLGAKLFATSQMKKTNLKTKPDYERRLSNEMTSDLGTVYVNSQGASHCHIGLNNHSAIFSWAGYCSWETGLCRHTHLRTDDLREDQAIAEVESCGCCVGHRLCESRSGATSFVIKVVILDS